MKKTLKITNFTIVLCLFICILTSCKNEQQNRTQPTPELSVMELSLKQQTFHESFSASIRGKQDIVIRPQVTGFITHVYVDEGSSVEKGQVLFRVDDVQFEEAVNIAKANITVAEASVATARLTAENKQALGERKVISNYEVQLAQNELGSANAQLALAKAELVSAQKNLSFTYIKSPTAGVIGKISSRIGSLVSPTMTDAITTVSESETMYAQFSLSEKKLLSLSKSSDSTCDIISNMPQVQLKLSDGTIYNELGTIKTISGTIDEMTGAASVRAAFPNTKGILRSGGTSVIIFPYAMNNSIVIPQSSTYEIQNKRFVYKIDESFKVSSKEIETYPLTNGSDFVVTKGLAEGDKIVIEGINTLRNDMIIKVKSVIK